MDGVTLGSPRRLTFANVLMSTIGYKIEYRIDQLLAYPQYVDQTCTDFDIADQALHMLKPHNDSHLNITFTKEQKKFNTLPFWLLNLRWINLSKRKISFALCIYAASR